MSRSAHATVAGAAALIFWAALLAAAPECGLILQALVEQVTVYPWNRRIAALAFILAVALLVARPTLRAIIGWIRRPIWTFADSTLTLMAVGGGLVMALSNVIPAPLLGLWPLTILTVALSAILAGRSLALVRVAHARIAEPDATNNRLLETRGMAPLRSMDEDELERGRVVDELYALVSVRRKESVNFGLEGSWGSGKTSLLNMLAQRLRQEGYNVVVFDLWSYRQPERLVRVYFDG